MDKTYIALLTVLLSILVSWFIKIKYDRFLEKKPIRTIKAGFKDEIRRIRKDIMARMPVEQYGKQAMHGLFREAKEISENLVGFYGARKGDLGILNDGDLIYNINNFYDKYDNWKEVRREVIDSLKKDGKVKFYPRNPLTENWILMQWLIEKAQELEKDLDEKII